MGQSNPGNQSDLTLEDALKRSASSRRIIGLIGTASVAAALVFALVRASQGPSIGWAAIVLGLLAGFAAGAALAKSAPPPDLAADRLRGSGYRIASAIDPKSQAGIVAVLVAVPFLDVLPTSIQAGVWGFLAGVIGWSSVFILRYGERIRAALVKAEQQTP